MRNNIIKKIFCFGLLFAFATLMLSCSKKEKDVAISDGSRNLYDLEQNVKNKNIAVAYFSINDDVKELAEKFVEALDADLVEIVPETPYTESDLDFNDENSRVKLEDDFNPLDKFTYIEDEEYETSEGITIATKAIIKEKKKITELPKIKSSNINKYPIVVVGFPVWYENAPKVIYTFMKELKNKVVVPFCTGGEMGQIDQYLTNMTDDSVQVMSGRSFERDASVDEIKEWVTMLSADFDLK